MSNRRIRLVASAWSFATLAILLAGCTQLDSSESPAGPDAVPRTVQVSTTQDEKPDVQEAVQEPKSTQSAPSPSPAANPALAWPISWSNSSIGNETAGCVISKNLVKNEEIVVLYRCPESERFLAIWDGSKWSHTSIPTIGFARDLSMVGAGASLHVAYVSHTGDAPYRNQSVVVATYQNGSWSSEEIFVAESKVVESNSRAQYYKEYEYQTIGVSSSGAPWGNEMFTFLVTNWTRTDTILAGLGPLSEMNEYQGRKLVLASRDASGWVLEDWLPWTRSEESIGAAFGKVGGQVAVIRSDGLGRLSYGFLENDTGTWRWQVIDARSDAERGTPFEWGGQPALMSSHEGAVVLYHRVDNQWLWEPVNSGEPYTLRVGQAVVEESLLVFFYEPFDYHHSYVARRIDGTWQQERFPVEMEANGAGMRALQVGKMPVVIVNEGRLGDSHHIEMFVPV